jgi:hypothetical protein
MEREPQGYVGAGVVGGGGGGGAGVAGRQEGDLVTASAPEKPHPG